MNFWKVQALIKEGPCSRVLHGQLYNASDISPRASCTTKVKPTEEVFNQAITSAWSK